MASLLTSACCAIALNCQLATAVTKDDTTTITVIARRCADPSTRRRLPRRPTRSEAEPLPAWRSEAGRLRQSADTSSVASSSNVPVTASRLSAPKRRARELERKPPTVAPSVAPAPTKPNIRRASREVST